MNPSTIGVDVSKDWLDAHRLVDGAARRFANDKTGRKALIKWMGATPVKRVVFEPTGPYHRPLERALDIAGLPIAKVNPRQARRFAEAAGKLVKTDRADAAMLARMGEVLDLAPRPCVSQLIAELKELHLARAALIKDRTAAKNRAKAITLSLLEKQNKRRIADIDAKMEEIDAAIEQRIDGDPLLARRFEILLSIPGVSKITAFALLIEMPELGCLEGGQASSLAGLAPVQRQSGSWKGHAFIRGGRAFLRQALYMPALVACRFNPQMKADYARLVEAGKPAKVAITAVMRRMIVLANALLRDDRLWAEKAPCP
ncbi:IS110 family transposase [Methylosinus sp. KRF6]|uniref:IS110 family transposase n=1 Tax=Methylosinus sp. KRF6 TaxID=2846853 RepID=UPI001C0D654C|nr:IS110 family transposase [Methylosinus sp. KRF6]MBU3891083.1 IS110 family transposase [Methylosinus sp. KRF6]